ncbi:MAG: DNA-processing protein DprA [Ferruginibacter sp.]
MNKELKYRIALTRLTQVGDVHAKNLVQVYGSAEAVFKAPRKQLEKTEGIGTVRAGSIKKFDAFAACEEEIAFIEKYKIRPLFLTDDDYPKRLLNCYDSPPLLYYRGNANLNAARIVSVVGTRNNSEYGKQFCEKLLQDLKDSGILVISGLAFGIDTIAHRNSLKNNLPTVGVLAHGLDRIYPSENKTLAKQMTENGGLLTDFCSGTKPDKQNFPKRNRIVAGICDALIIVESGKKGGALITAELANSYNKDVFALPGKITDSKSEGCNYLIRSNKASLITCADDLLQFMNWDETKKPAKKQQRELFIELQPDEKIIVDILKETDNLPIDEIYLRTGLSSSATAQALLMLEMEGLVKAMPGKIYILN